MTERTARVLVYGPETKTHTPMPGLQMPGLMHALPTILSRHSTMPTWPWRMASASALLPPMVVSPLTSSCLRLAFLLPGSCLRACASNASCATYLIVCKLRGAPASTSKRQMSTNPEQPTCNHLGSLGALSHTTLVHMGHIGIHQIIVHCSLLPRVCRKTSDHITHAHP